MSERLIKHQGIVCELYGGVAKIKLINISACTSCYAKAACSVSEIDNKVVEVSAEGKSLTAGDKVFIVYNDALGLKALLLGYIAPFVVMLLALFLTWAITHDETQAGVAALLSLAPYYLILAYFKKRLHQTFSFRLEKMNT